MQGNTRARKPNILFLTQFSMLLAIEAIFCFTPLGSIPIGPIVATLAAVPVVITGVTLGTGAGTAMGFITGLFSFLVWTFTPPQPVLAFLYTPFYSFNGAHGNFLSLVICFVPRILIGTVAGASFSLFSKISRRHPALRAAVACTVSGILGSLTNTVLTLGFVYLFFGPQFAQALGKSYGLLLALIGATIVTNGIPEAIINGVAAVGVGLPVRRLLKKKT